MTMATEAFLDQAGECAGGGVLRLFGGRDNDRQVIHGCEPS
jgi:hypothetical protein